MSNPLVVTFGEALLRLSPPVAEPLRGATALSLHVGGAEANVAVGLASLGLAARYFGRLPANDLGERVLGELRRHGVDVSYVERGPERMGLYFLEEGVGPRPARVTYDRAGSAFAHVGEQGAAVALDAGLMGGASAFVTSGITMALGAGPRAAAARLWRAAGTAGATRVYDVNFRSRLCTAAEAVAHAAPLLADAEVVVVAERDALALHGGVPQLRAAAPRALVVVTRGADGATAHLPAGDVVEQPALGVAEAGRIGRGDAFLAGFLFGHLGGRGVAGSLALGVASASLKSTWAGDLPDLRLADVEALADAAARGGPDTVVQR